jgi:hypothetical protein
MDEFSKITPSTVYGINQRAVIANTTLGYNSGNGGFARSPTALRALKTALQEILGSGRWYGTMSKECMTVWIMETTGLEEVIAEEMKAKKKKGERKQKKEQKREERNAELRRRTKAMAIAYYVKEAEYYIEEREYECGGYSVSCQYSTRMPAFWMRHAYPHDVS